MVLVKEESQSEGVQKCNPFFPIQWHKITLSVSIFLFLHNYILTHVFISIFDANANLLIYPEWAFTSSCFSMAVASFYVFKFLVLT